MINNIRKTDKKLLGIISKEKERQNKTINLIASENIAPDSVLKLLGSEITNKYCEGYPNHRYYPGCVECDKIELIARKRALDVFNLDNEKWDVNVQPYSGAIANLAIYFALLNTGDRILSMSLDAGGHLSHGSKASITGKVFNVKHYGVDNNYDIDYEEIENLSKQHKPKIIISGASAYPKRINFKKIGIIAKKIGAYHLADISHYAGLISAEEYPSPFPYADVVMTTTHKSLMGPRGAIIFSNKKSLIAKKRKVEISRFINRAIFPGLQGGPHFNTISAIANGLYIVKNPKFKKYIKQVLKNSYSLADNLKKMGFKIAGNTTESHMFLIDVSKIGIDGKDAENFLENIGILANRNSISGDKNPNKPSAIRIGTYSVTERGMKEADMRDLANIIDDTLMHKSTKTKISKRVKILCKKFPIDK